MNRNIAVKAGMLLGVAMLTACASTGSKPTEVSYKGCSFPETPTGPAPAWVCGQEITGYKVSSWGMAKKSALGPSYMQDVAATEARQQLSQRFATDIKSALSVAQQQREHNGLNESAAEITRVIQTVTAMDLMGSNIVESRVSPAGNMYVLVGLNDDAYKRNFEELFANQLEPEIPGLYKQFLQEEAVKSLLAVK